jgi:hypothetical protein
MLVRKRGVKRYGLDFGYIARLCGSIIIIPKPPFKSSTRSELKLLKSMGKSSDNADLNNSKYCQNISVSADPTDAEFVL